MAALFSSREMRQLQLCSPHCTSQALSTVQQADSSAQNGAFIQNRAGTGSTLSRRAHGSPRRWELQVWALSGDGEPAPVWQPRGRVCAHLLLPSWEYYFTFPNRNSDFLGQGDKEKPNLKDLVCPSSNAALSILREISLGIQLRTYRKCQITKITIFLYHLRAKNDLRCSHWSTRTTDQQQEAVCPKQRTTSTQGIPWSAQSLHWRHADTILHLQFARMHGRYRNEPHRNNRMELSSRRYQAWPPEHLLCIFCWQDCSLYKGTCLCISAPMQVISVSHWTCEHRRAGDTDHLSTNKAGLPQPPSRCPQHHRFRTRF